MTGRLARHSKDCYCECRAALFMGDFAAAEALIGPPLMAAAEAGGVKSLLIAMKEEHCDRLDAAKPFDTSNGVKGAMPEREWEFVNAPDVKAPERYVDRFGASAANHRARAFGCAISLRREWIGLAVFGQRDLGLWRSGRLRRCGGLRQRRGRHPGAGEIAGGRRFRHRSGGWGAVGVLQLIVRYGRSGHARGGCHDVRRFASGQRLRVGDCRFGHDGRRRDRGLG